jgi:hypothetical protein
MSARARMRLSPKRLRAKLKKWAREEKKRNDATAS